MIEISSNQLKTAVETQHGGNATFIQSVPVHERQGDRTIWSGEVSVFDLRYSTSGAFRAYAWSRELPDGKPQFITILHSPQTVSPAQAVRAAILGDTGTTK
jgi:hypothetical protein